MELEFSRDVALTLEELEVGRSNAEVAGYFVPAHLPKPKGAIDVPAYLLTPPVNYRSNTKMDYSGFRKIEDTGWHHPITLVLNGRQFVEQKSGPAYSWHGFVKRHKDNVFNNALYHLVHGLQMGYPLKSVLVYIYFMWKLRRNED